ncbi:MAG: tRNA (adenosine(37)-N6)-threonylcarbamoyltransferase complex transferase subunit TsaD [Bacteroidia bacterium]|nr:tRNA (adenosine(37)-N6)-threonylcarbamoyltransferase complex transferase subunit TsaD [Bacteroidia bacterium]MDW8157477.1 tRNA (adenosine(37)-N6)-threonylcarbamoyltransferase complex transferase subunit TsaD [Bacteroidia bacterium]
MSKPIIILGIESSCDETAAAICQEGKIVANIISTQFDHARYGGVVPELASRLHQAYILPVVEQALERANVAKEDLSAIAFTVGPGLPGALMVGVNFAKGLALGLGCPLIAVDHLLGHIVSLFIEEPFPSFPFICLTASGGHTQLSLVKSILDIEVLGKTIDDAAGEAFDKAAKLLGLPFPGGPQIDKLAQGGKVDFHQFPEPKVEGFNFSFSGLKTSFLYYLRREVAKQPDFISKHLEDICASLQHRIVTTLLNQLTKAAEHYQVTNLAIAGGVSANSYLRKLFFEACKQKKWNAFIPPFKYCTDNAAMIALTGYYQYLRSDFVSHKVTALPNGKF